MVQPGCNYQQHHCVHLVTKTSHRSLHAALYVLLAGVNEECHLIILGTVIQQLVYLVLNTVKLEGMC